MATRCHGAFQCMQTAAAAADADKCRAAGCKHGAWFVLSIPSMVQCFVSCPHTMQQTLTDAQPQLAYMVHGLCCAYHRWFSASSAVARRSGSRVSRLLSRSNPASDSVRPSKRLTGNLLSKVEGAAGNLNCMPARRGFSSSRQLEAA